MAEFTREHRVNELREAIAVYKPGFSVRFGRQRPVNPPLQLRVGLFGPTGVGKSALINSMYFAMGNAWKHIAPEGPVTEPSKTKEPSPYDITTRIRLIDNRGMRSLGGPFMSSLAQEVGIFGDAGEVQWNLTFLSRIVTGLERALQKSNSCDIDCAVLVVSALNICVTADDMKELMDTIRKITGEPPIIVITHRHHPDIREEVVSTFNAGLQAQRIDYVFEIENYTSFDHQFDIEKHIVALEALDQCTIVGDRVMKHKEKESSCEIL